MSNLVAPLLTVLQKLASSVDLTAAVAQSIYDPAR